MYQTRWKSTSVMKGESVVSNTMEEHVSYSGLDCCIKHDGRARQLLRVKLL